MKHYTILFLVIFLSATLGACASSQKKVEQEAKQPVNCATAEADLRVLENEKTHLAEQIASGVTAIAPIGLAVGVITHTEGTKFRVATGEYNEMLEKRIAEIKQKCGIE